jgi:hypothetical protein
LAPLGSGAGTKTTPRASTSRAPRARLRGCAISALPGVPRFAKPLIPRPIAPSRISPTRFGRTEIPLSSAGTRAWRNSAISRLPSAPAAARSGQVSRFRHPGPPRPPRARAASPRPARRVGKFLQCQEDARFVIYQRPASRDMSGWTRALSRARMRWRQCERESFSFGRSPPSTAARPPLDRRQAQQLALRGVQNTVH